MSRWGPDELNWVAAQVPPDTERDYEYQPRPCRPPDVDPIPPEVWRKRFYECRSSGHGSAAITRVPKRLKEFRVSDHITEPEDLWGLYVQYRWAFLGVFSYCFLLAAGPFTFWIWWLRNNPGDWQTAVVPLTTLLPLFVAIWYTGGEDFRKLI